MQADPMVPKCDSLLSHWRRQLRPSQKERYPGNLRTSVGESFIVPKDNGQNQNHFSTKRDASGFFLTRAFQIFLQAEEVVSLPTRKLRRLIVNTATGEFLAPNGKWTAHEQEAENFKDITSVLEACAKYKVEQAEILLRFEEGHDFDMRLPLRRSARRAGGGASNNQNSPRKSA